MADGPPQQPPERLKQRLRRWRRSARVFRPFTRWVLTWGVALALPVFVLFLATGAGGGDWEALQILIGIESPFASDVDAVAVPLAVLGFLWLPTLIGAVAAGLIEQRLDRLRTDVESLRTELEALVRTTIPGARTRAATRGLSRDD